MTTGVLDSHGARRRVRAVGDKRNEAGRGSL